LPLVQNEKPYVDVKRELLLLAVPALAGQAIDPLSQLMETAYIGRLGLHLSLPIPIPLLFHHPLLCYVIYYCFLRHRRIGFCRRFRIHL